ncbi:GGDEF domain-containing protein [Aestuariibacter sp. A3R04]|uniref:GGDEF domain-containing protein n=1 Tax=Aestuariibacter sp. A3R04 TaxID=2841571 RepID=UPI001C0A0F49|nr:GGDEF domain-containing protein [Aestuariibacter sp. A3R04]MBU3022464.1 GGDEF domain-containing protein [Aestuariibacter sp. A3R04]
MLFSPFNKLLNRGCRSNYDEETNRRIVVINLFALVGIILTFILGITALLGNDLSLGISLLAASSFFFLASQIQASSRNRFGHLIAVYLLTGCLMGLETYLIITGGYANTGPLWIYLLPPVAMFFGGFSRGLVVMGGFTLLIAIILFFPHDALLLTEYSHPFKTRLLYSFVTVTFLSAFYEYSRQRTYQTVRDLSAEFERQALHDTLTKLPNRRGMRQLMEQEIKRHQRNKLPLSVVLTDIDNFKKVNDTYGHGNGDIILKRTADILRQNIRRQDLVCRWGGEEFLIVLPETNETNAATLAEKIRKTLADSEIWLDERKIGITASFGICEINEDVSVDRALTLADKALYQAKHQGRNRVVLSHDN